MNVILLLLAIPCVLTPRAGPLKAAATKWLILMGIAMGSIFLSQQFAGTPPSWLPPDRWTADGLASRVHLRAAFRLLIGPRQKLTQIFAVPCIGAESIVDHLCQGNGGPDKVFFPFSGDAGRDHSRPAFLIYHRNFRFLLTRSPAISMLPSADRRAISDICRSEFLSAVTVFRQLNAG